MPNDKNRPVWNENGAPMPRFIQIHVAPYPYPDKEGKHVPTLFALDEEGVVWLYDYGYGWTRFGKEIA